jgi:erythromycin esterase-like protein
LLLPVDEHIERTSALDEALGSATIVLIGEATHGTHEFYAMRSTITKHLIARHGFSAVCIEGDWPDAYRVNRYVRGAEDDAEAAGALGSFRRFPTWMWRNAEVLDFVAWLREYNDRRPHEKAGFYGLDLYSMYASIDAVLRFLDTREPQAAARAREHYGCLENTEEGAGYAYSVLAGVHRSCRDDVIAVLRDVQSSAARTARIDGVAAQDEYFYAEQNARVVAGAEQYYRTMLDESVSSWNLRDMHMVDTLERLLSHFERTQRPRKAVVWAHNSHVGDARSTSMGRRGEVNVGSLVRSRHGAAAFSVGFTTYNGTVTAASGWHEPERRMRVRDALSESYEALFHATGLERFSIDLRANRPRLAGLPPSLLERAIGVVYRPQSERSSHYFRADLLHQFDFLYHFDQSRAVEPLERTQLWTRGEVPETYPSGV